MKRPSRAKTKHKCIQCGVIYFKYVSPSRGTKYCSLQCAGKARLIGKAEVKHRHAIYLKEKMANDPEFRAKRLARKRAYYQENKEHFNKKNKEYRRRPGYQQKHNEYLRNKPGYAEYKHAYDRRLRCEKQFGEYWEAASVLIDIDQILAPKRYELRKINGTLNKAINRSRNGKVKRSYT